MLSAQQILSNWSAGVQGAGAKYTAGVQAVTENPAAKASTPDALAAYAAGTAAAAAPGGAMQTGLAGVTLGSWQQACATVGARNLTTGAQKGSPKYSAWLQSKGYAAMQQAKAAAAAITGPKGDGRAMARFQAAMNAMKAAKK